MNLKQQRGTLTAIAVGLAFSAGAASAATISITVTNNQDVGGLSATPLYLGFHDGSFDAFDAGGTASAGVELIAETGDASVVAGERLAVDPDSQGLVIASPDGPPPIQPGESITAEIDLTSAGATFLTFLSMVLPSNDTFLGNDDPLAYQILDADGNFTGPLTIDVTGEQIYDAGTEANALLGSAFVAGEDISLSPDGEGSIQQGLDLSVFAGAELATGDILGSADQIDFVSDPANFSLLTISIEEVAPIPLPATAPMLAAGLGLLGWRMRRRQKQA